MKGQQIRRAGAAALLALSAGSLTAGDTAGWVLNKDKSVLAGDVSACRHCVGVSPANAGVILASTGVAPKTGEGALRLQGGELSFESDVRFRARLDGQDYPIAGLPAADTIAIEVREDDDVVSTIKSEGRRVAIFKRSVSADQKTLKLTARYFNDGDQLAREVLVFERSGSR
jgi:hypothetical protein